MVIVGLKDHFSALNLVHLQGLRKSKFFHSLSHCYVSYASSYYKQLVNFSGQHSGVRGCDRPPPMLARTKIFHLKTIEITMLLF